MTLGCDNKSQNDSAVDGNISAVVSSLQYADEEDSRKAEIRYDVVFNLLKHKCDNVGWQRS